MIESERIQHLNSITKSDGKLIFYWMQQSQRTHFNHALQYAIEQANERKLPLVVYFGLTDAYPEANLRHYMFMIEGLTQVYKQLHEMGIQFILRKEDPSEGILKLSEDASLVIVDRGYTRIQTEWRNKVAASIECPFIQVESDVVVPVKTASSKEEYGAYTIRPKINKSLEHFLKNLKEIKPKISSLPYDFKSLHLSNIQNVLKNLSLDTSVPPSFQYKGGFSKAKKYLDDFLTKRLKKFEIERNNPSKVVCSNLSPYLHFGQISPVFIALQAMKKQGSSVHAFLEELIIRRELSMNFVSYNKKYDSLECLPQWAYDTLIKHERDKREYIYSKKELEQAKTHDIYWNAAQKEMVITGKMHGYMRMYWGKKIIEWTTSPKQAFQYALYLNNKYELDGRDPNGYAGIAWCFGKHDRAWKERTIFGKIRYMNSKGLERKGDIETYVKNINTLEQTYLNTF